VKTLFALVVLSVCCVGCDRDGNANRGNTENNKNRTPVTTGGPSDGGGAPTQGQPSQGGGTQGQR